MDEVCDDHCPLRGCGLAENHQLHPLRDTVEEGDESLQDRVVHCAAMSHETVIVLELGAQGLQHPGLPLTDGCSSPSSCPLVVTLWPQIPPCDPVPPDTPSPAHTRLLTESPRTRILQKERYSK